MLKKSLLFLLSFSVFINFIMPVSTNVANAADDTVYSRNGEVYVMIGEGTRMGVYANQELIEGKRQTHYPNGVYLFGDGTTLDPVTNKPKMSFYQSIAVDQFRNIYVLSGKLDPGLIGIPDDSYFPVDPPLGEGIVGLGKSNGVEYHDVVNHYDLVYPNHHQTQPFPERAKERRPGAKGFAVLAGVCNENGLNVVRPAVPTGKDSQGNDILTNYQNKYPQRKGSIKRIPLDYWYQGLNDWTTLDDGKKCGYSNQIMQITWQIKFDVKVQRVNLWISHYVAATNIPAGVILPPIPAVAPDPAITPNKVNDMMENVFNTTNMQYTRQRSTSCAESDHPGFLEPTSGKVATDYKIGFTTTGAGRRYVYSSLPSPKIKRGTIKLVSNNTYGIPQLDSKDFTALDSSQILNDKTFSIGAATKNADEDYIYTAPQKDDSGMDIIDFAIADQWDGTGGVRYILLQASGSGNHFDLKKAKMLKWNKMKGYMIDPDPTKSGTMPMDNNVKVIAGDGSGSVYYLTDPKAQLKKAGNSDTFWGKDSTVNDFMIGGTKKPLATPGKPDGPIKQPDGRIYYTWYRFYSTDAASELWSVNYDTQVKKKENYFTVGTVDAIVREDFADADAKTPLNTGEPQQIPPGITDIKLALATINLAGPPTGNNQKMVADIASSNATQTPIKDITYSSTDSGLGGKQVVGDEIVEDTQYRCYAENTPLFFSNDGVKKNVISGSSLENPNNNDVTGGFEFSVRPATSCFYWHVEMVEPVKKTINLENLEFTTDTRTLASNAKFTVPSKKVKLTQLTTVPNGWNAIADKNERDKRYNLGDGTWYCSRGSNADKTGNIGDQENSEAPEAFSDFAFTPKEPGVYRICLVSSARKWDYSKLGYPSYITDRDTVPGCKDNKTHYLFFDNGEGNGVAGNGVKDGTEGYISERYVVVTAKKAQADDYISQISLEGPPTIGENEVGIWTAKATVKFAKSINHEKISGDIVNGAPLSVDAAKMATFNGIGVWDYPADVVAAWGLPNTADLDYVKGAAGHPSNFYAKTNTIETLLRNYGEIPPGAVEIAPPPEIDAKGAPVYGTSKEFASWVKGAGTNTSPKEAINKADRGAIEYEWCLAAEYKDFAKDPNLKAADTKVRQFVGTDIIPGSEVKDVSDPRRLPHIVIARGRLSDENTFPAQLGNDEITKAPAPTGNAVAWEGNVYTNPDRKFNVEVKLRYAFDMPVADGKYYLYIKFKYPTLKWEGRSPKKDKDGNEVFAYYDLVDAGYSETLYDTNHWVKVETNTAVPGGYAITVTDRQPPQAYFVSSRPNKPNFTDPDPAKEIRGILPNESFKPADLPKGVPGNGVPFSCATTGDPFPGNIIYNVYDNNPNKAMNPSKLKILVGESINSLKFDQFEPQVDNDSPECAVYFNEGALTSVLMRMIYPSPSSRKPGEIQDTTTAVSLKDYVYDQNVPHRHVTYKFVAPSPNTTRADNLGTKQIPYDMTGTLPMYAIGSDGSGNLLGDADIDKKLTDVQDTIDNGAKTTENRLQTFNAPAYLTVEDNDPPTIVFHVSCPRTNSYREYTVSGTGKIDDIGFKGHAADDKATHDLLVWDDENMRNRLVFSSYGNHSVSAIDYDFSGNPLRNFLNQNGQTALMTEQPADNLKCIQMTETTNNPDIQVATNADGAKYYSIGFNKRGIKIHETYNKQTPANVAYYNFDEIVKGTTGDTLEIIEDSRTRFEITLTDNVDGRISANIYTDTTANELNPEQCYLDTQNLADQATLKQIFDASLWRQVPNKKSIEMYGIFRNQTSNSTAKPYFFLAAKDKAGNATVVKIPAEVLHTYLKTNVLNVETRRSE